MTGTRKTFVTGTHRVRHPDETWSLIRPKLAGFGITRVNEITGLDTLGVPVAAAVRPLAKTVSVAQGKGLTSRLARVSAAMEAIELWHAENVDPPLARLRTPARSRPLPYRLASLVDPGGLVTDATPLDWVDATGLRTGATVGVPADLVRFIAGPDQPWRPHGLPWTSNGLASGNSRPEACVHALCEVIERDAIDGRTAGEPVPVDPTTVDDAGCAELIDRIRSVGAELRLRHLPSRFGVPCFAATVWSIDFPVLGLGWGAHTDAGVALSRAVTEAAQSRLAAIAGSRDDLPPLYGEVRDGTGRRTEDAPEALRPWRDVRDQGAPQFTDVAAELDWLGRTAESVVGCEPLVVDYGHDPDIAVVKVLVPGAVSRMHARR